MKTLMLTAMLLLLPGLALADGMGTTHGHDLDALWAQAQQTHDLQVEDAILLLESREITFVAGGDLTTTVHRVVWVNTAVGIRGYADLRVPWNTTDSTLDVEILRTWRAGRWWPDVDRISDTAVVHTLPHALDRADDYTTLRETMLLHDGVELGCIMETRYTITTTGQPGRGGVFVFPRRDPAMRVELKVTGATVGHQEMNGIGEPETSGQTLTWRRENLPRLKLPLTADAAAYEPAVAWSTWPDWETLGNTWLASCEQAAVLTPEQAGELHTRLAGQVGTVSRLEVVGKYLNDMTRPVHYPDRFWTFAPRPADRTVATAYGHTLDRAVLALALLREAGFQTEIAFLGHGSVLVGESLARLADAGDPVFLLPACGGLIFRPDTGRISDMASAESHVFWKLGEAPKTMLGLREHPDHPSELKVTVNLEPGDDSGWQGTLFLKATGKFNAQAALLAAEDFQTGAIADLLTSLLPQAEITQARLDAMSPYIPEVRVDFTLPDLETDSHGLTVLELGRPAGGFMDHLPANVHLYDQERESPVFGLDLMRQTITLRLKTDGNDGVQPPAPLSLDNPAGSFSLTVAEADGWLVLERKLETRAGVIPAGDWPGLRQLLLAASDPVLGTVVIR